MAGVRLEVVQEQILASIDVKRQLLENAEAVRTIGAVASECVAAFRRGNRVLIAGNGGSAADAQHMAAELVCRFGIDRPALPAICLTADASTLTAIGNDYGYERVFARQIEANAQRGDVFIAISTSGKSTNVLQALEKARELELKTIGLTGSAGAEMSALCDVCIRIPSDSTPRVQEAHILIVHIVCSLIEAELFGSVV